MVRGGYGQITQAVASCLDVRLNSPVTNVMATEGGASVTTQSGNSLLTPASKFGGTFNMHPENPADTD